MPQKIWLTGMLKRGNSAFSGLNGAEKTENRAYGALLCGRNVLHMAAF